jgi:Ca2+-transporting ATPase
MINSKTSGIHTKPTQWFQEGVQSVIAVLCTDPTLGLTEAEAESRLKEYGPNRLIHRRRVTFFGTLREELFEEPLVLFLIAVGILYALWGSFTDALAIFAIIVLLALSEGFNEYRAKRAIAALRDLSAPTARVVREGSVWELAAEDLVPGDLVLLAAGDRVPTDLRLIETAALSVDESALTGESLPATKDADARLNADAPLADRITMVHAGTVVTHGRGRGIAVTTGMATEVGRIAGLVNETKEPKTPLQRMMRDLACKLTLVAVGVSLLVPAIGLVLGQPFKEMVLTGLTLAFATVPEELPILITMVLAFGAYHLSQRGAIVKRLRSAETLGSVNLLLLDKTGTLTENRIRVVALMPASGLSEDRLIQLAATATDTTRTPEGLVGDAIDVALVEKAQSAGAEPLTVEELIPFDEVKRMMAAVAQGNLIVKGAPEAVLAHATALSIEDFEAAQEWVERYASQGERVIAVGARPADAASDGTPLTGALEFIGLIAFADPPRAEAAGAISMLHHAHVRTVMVTGDHPATAQKVASEVGIPADRVVTGRELATMDDNAIGRALKKTNIFARVSPAEKLHLTQVGQQAGETVAVTGDGVNDAPALRAASVGVAMGEGGTDVAREAADLILTDDNVNTISRAIHEGRLLFDNLSGAVRYYLAAKVALILVAFLPVVFGYPVPLTPIQIIVMEFFMDLGASATFVTERAAGRLINRSPRPQNEPFLNRSMVLTILSGGAILGAGVLIPFFWEMSQGSLEHARTAAFTTWLVAHVALAVSFRRAQTWSGALALWAFGAFGLVAIASLVGPVRQWLQTAPLNSVDVGGIVLMAIVVLILGGLAQWVFRR